MNEIRGTSITSPIRGLTKVVIIIDSDSKPLVYTAKQGETFAIISRPEGIDGFAAVMSSVTGPVIAVDIRSLFKYVKADQNG